MLEGEKKHQKNIGQFSECRQLPKLLLFCTILLSDFPSQTFFSPLHLRASDPSCASSLRALDPDSDAGSEQRFGTKDSSPGWFEEVQSVFYRFPPCCPPAPLPTSICCANSAPLRAPPLLTLEAKEQSGSDQSLPRRGWRYWSGLLATLFLTTVSQTFCNWPMILLTSCNLKVPVCKIWPYL